MSYLISRRFVRFALVSSVVAAALVASTAPALAAVGASPDPAYAPAGRVLGGGASFLDFNGVVPDAGGLLAYGTSTSGEQYSPELWQLTTAGRFGALWGGTGRFTTDLADEHSIDAVLRLRDGGLLLASSTETADGDPLVRFHKLTAAGTTDLSFGVSGIATHQNGIYRPRVEALVEFSDGSIGYFGRQSFGGIGGNQRNLLGRITASGTRIQEYSDGEWAYERDGSEEASYYGFNDAAEVGGDRVLVVGDRSIGGGTRSEAVVRRVNADGSLDTSFGSGGVAAFRPRASWLTLDDVAFDPARHAASGRVIVAGMELPKEGNDVTSLRVIRLEPNGAIDPTFGGSQGVRIPIYGGSSDVRVIERPDGGVFLLLVGNPAPRLLERDLLMVSLTARGTLDPSFDRGGMSVLDSRFNAGTLGTEFFQMTSRPDGTVWVLAARDGVPALWLINGASTAPRKHATPRVSVDIVRGGKVLGCGRTVAKACVVKSGQRVSFRVSVTAPRGAGQKVGGQLLYGPAGNLFTRPVNGRQVHGARRFTIPASSRRFQATLPVQVPRNDTFANSQWSFVATTTAGGNFRRSGSAQVYVLYQ